MHDLWILLALPLPLLLACVKEPGVMSATDTTTGDATTSDTEGTTEDPTEGTTEGTTEDPTEGTTEDPTEDPTDGQVWPLCIDPDPAATASFAFDVTAWSVESPVEIDAPCVVASFLREGDVVSAELLCSDADHVDVSIPLSLTIPGDMPLALAVDQAVALRFNGHAEAHHQIAGSYFAIHDTEGGELVVAGFTDQWNLAALGEVSAPLTFEDVETVCPSVCYDALCEDGLRRDAVKVADGEDAIVIVDQNRGTLVAASGTYDVVVIASATHFCLNCYADRRLIVTRASE
ncbi:MAG: hypothetical protein R3B09_09640 [Nannocystaceae bacterium]